MVSCELVRRLTQTLTSRDCEFLTSFVLPALLNTMIRCGHGPGESVCNHTAKALCTDNIKAINIEQFPELSMCSQKSA